MRAIITMKVDGMRAVNIGCIRTAKTPNSCRLPTLQIFSVNEFLSFAWQARNVGLKILLSLATMFSLVSHP